MGKFNFMSRLDNDKKWRDITEEEAACLLRVYFSADEIPEKIRDIKCGHKYDVRGTQIEAWPKVGELEEDVKLLLNNECINCQIGARCWLISDSTILPQHLLNGLLEDGQCRIKRAIEKLCMISSQ